MRGIKLRKSVELLVVLVVIFLLVAVVIVLAFSAFSLVGQIDGAQKQVNELQSQLAYYENFTGSLQTKASSLESQIYDLQNPIVNATFTDISVGPWVKRGMSDPYRKDINVTYQNTGTTSIGGVTLALKIDGNTTNIDNFLINIKPPIGVFFDFTYRGYLLLSNLSDGNHSVTVYRGHQFSASHERYLVSAYSTVDFIVDTSSPKISVLSPEAKVYNISDISLNYTANEPISKATYSLDGQENMTASDSIFFANLTSGMHNVTVYGWDVVGNVGSSETVTFSVVEPELAELFPVVPVAAVSVAVALTVAGVLVYHKKHKESQNP